MKCHDVIIESLNNSIDEQVYYANNFSGERDIQAYYVTSSGNIITADINKNPELDTVWIESEDNKDYKNICDYILSKLIIWKES